MQKRIFTLIVICMVIALEGSTLYSAVRVYAQAENPPQEETGQETKSSNGAVQLAAPHGVLMEASTGKVIYEKEKDVRVSPASITKIMTLILIFDAVEQMRKLPPAPTPSQWEGLRSFWKKGRSRRWKH